MAVRKRVNNKSTGRNYKREAANETEKRKKERAARMRARRKAQKEGKVKKGDNRRVDHKDGNPLNNSRKNIKIIPRNTSDKQSKNRRKRKA